MGSTRAASSATRPVTSHPTDSNKPESSTVPGPIAPYGGRLVDRTVRPDRRRQLVERAGSLPELRLDGRVLSDLYLLSVGAFSPLVGFMSRETYVSVVEEMSLPMGLPWTIPVVLPVGADEVTGFGPGDEVALLAPSGELAGTLEVSEVFARDVEREAERVYGTTDSAHPGVAAIQAQGTHCLSGAVHYAYTNDISGFPADHLTPEATRRHFEEAGWRSVVAFQTRNPIHRAHEYLQKCALEIVEGLLVHPLVGETKSDDVPAEVRMECYRVLLERYFPGDRVLLSVLPAAMRYAGPREAVFHAIMRRNYGCTHLIVGRDHAGVGDFYGTYDAQRIFDEIDADALGIRPLNFEHAFYCRLTQQMATSKTSPADPDQRVFLSGTKLREMLRRGERPPAEFTRPEVANILLQAYRD
jgi:sulfate adenylyltransferase